MPMETTHVPTMRQLMPRGFLRALRESTGCRERSTLSGVVLYESTSSKYWPHIVALAKETDPAGFTKWEAAQLQPAQ